MKIIFLFFTLSLVGSEILGSSFTADSAAIPPSLQYLLDERIGPEYELITLDEASISDSVKANLPDARINMTIMGDSWDITLNEFDIRSETTAEGDPNTYSGNVYGYPARIVRMYFSPRLVRGMIFDGSYIYRIIPIDEYGEEFSGLNGIYVYTKTLEEPYELIPQMGDCEEPILEFAIFADYEFYQYQNEDVDLVVDRILAAMLEVHFVYMTNFNLDIRILGPYVYTAPDGLGNNIIKITNSLSTRWLFQFPCLNTDVIFLFSGAHLPGGGMASASGCYNPTQQTYPVAYIDWRGNLVLNGGHVPSWYIALVHEIGHLLGANEDDNTSCISECSSPTCMPPIMCQTGCIDPNYSISFSSCSRNAIQSRLNGRCNTCYADPIELCESCVEIYKISGDRSAPLVPSCDSHNEMEVTFQFANNCDEEEIVFGFTFNPEVVEITDLGDFEEIVSPFPGNPQLDFLITESFSYGERESSMFSFAAKLIGDQQSQGANFTRFTLKKNGSSIIPGFPFQAYIDLHYVHTYDITGPQDFSDIIDLGGPLNITSGNISGCNAKNPPLRISGVLNFDTDYCLKETVVIMEPDVNGASIVVEEGKNLILDANYIFGCESLWDAISLEEGASLEVWNCTIEDAEYAVQLFTDASVYVRNTTFNNNYISIYAPYGHTGRKVNVSRDVHFEQNNTLKDNSHSYVDALSGLVLNGVQGAVISGGINTPFSPLQSINTVSFRNIKHGILLGYSDAIVRGVTFEDTDIGVSAVSDGSNILYVDGGLLAENYFRNCGVGINTDNVNLVVTRSTFNNVSSGISMRLFGNYQTHIVGNIIEAQYAGISIGYPFEITGKIANNTISVDNPLGIGISGIALNGNLDITGNIILVDGARAGIKLLRSQGVEITSNNEVLILNTNNNEPRGIEILDCRNCNVSCNDVIGDNVEEDAWGLIIQDSPDMVYSCNKTSNLAHNTQFLGLCTNTDYRGTNIGIGYAGLELGSSLEGSEAIIGVQSHRGNLWQSTYDWKGAWHYSSNLSILQSSLFITKPTASLNPPNVTELISGGWFIQEMQGTTFVCEEEIDCEVDLVQVHEEDLNLLDSMEFSEHSSMKNWLKERQIFHRLETGLIDPSSHVDLNNFYSAGQSSVIGEQVVIDKDLRSALQMFGQDSSDRIEYINERSEYMDSLMTLGLELLTADSAETIVINANIDSIVTALETQHVNDTNWVQSHYSSVGSDLASVEDANDQISVKEDWEEYDKVVTKILLNSMDGDTLNVSSVDSATLVSIASICAFEGGPGVYHARAICSLIDTVIYNDLDVCGNVSPRSMRGSEKFSKSTLQIIPNPAANEIQVIYHGETLPDRLVIVSLSGAEMNSYEVKEFNSRYSTSNLPAGMYILQATSKSKVLGTTKLVIVKN